MCVCCGLVERPSWRELCDECRRNVSRRCAEELEGGKDFLVDCDPGDEAKGDDA